MTTKLAWTTVQKRIDDLIPQKVNPRNISDKQMSDLKQSLKKYNLVEIPVIDIDGAILAGHQRLKAMKLLGRGQEVIDVRIPNRKLTEKEANRYLIASNKLGGDWDFEKLQLFDTDLLLESGFDQIELSDIWDDVTKIDEENFDEEVEIKKTKKPVTQIGDLIELGSHRLICGNSESKYVLSRLCGKEKVSMIYSDPPYNISLDYDKGIGGKKTYGGHVKDDLTDKEYKDFLFKTISASLPFADKNTHVFYWCDQKYIGLLQTIYKELGIDNKRVCLWIKNGHNPTPNVAFNKCYEPCVYGTTGKPYIAKKFQDLNEIINQEATSGNNLLDEIDIWTAKRLSSKDYEHATSKPPALHEKAIRRCTKVNDIILDSFGGSGSTLIAGQQLKRRVYLVEKEPTFCDLIIKRFEKLTGIKAKITHEK